MSVISSSVEGDGGPWVWNGHVSTHPLTVSRQDLGDAVLAALDASRHRWPAGDRRSGVSAVLKVLRMRSWAQYSRGARFVSVSREDGRIVVSPQHNGGPTGRDRGSRDVTEFARVVESSDPSDLGTVVLTAMRQAS